MAKDERNKQEDEEEEREEKEREGMKEGMRRDKILRTLVRNLYSYHLHVSIFCHSLSFFFFLL